MYLRALLGAALLLWASASPAQAQIVEMYRWTDAAGIVHFTNNLNEIPEQFRSGATLIRRAEMPPAPVAPPAPERASIQFQRRGDLMVVKSVLNGSLSVNLVVDTGASYTTISQATAAALKLDPGLNPTVLSFNTANGVIQAPLATVRSMEVGGMELKDVTVAIHDVFPDAGVAGLLGLNFLSNFRLDIDSQSGLLNLQKKSN
jgi:clan AA aspartic protease (TIGR02281 family)